MIKQSFGFRYTKVNKANEVHVDQRLPPTPEGCPEFPSTIPSCTSLL